MEHICTCARAYPFLYLGDGWTYCTKIWYVDRNLLAMRTHVMGAVHLQVLTCIPAFHITKINGRVVLKFGALLETH